MTGFAPVLPMISALRAQGLMLATAESCTGGMIAAAITDIAGSSDVFDRAFVTYSNAAKAAMLGVPPGLIDAVGAVSEAAAAAMAQGALRHSLAGLALSVTGIAGPGGASPGKPVGLVWFGAALRGGAVGTECRIFHGDRAAVRAASVVHALGLGLRILAAG